MIVSRCKFFVNEEVKGVLILTLNMRHTLLFIFPATVLIVFLTVYGNTESNYTKSDESNYQPALRLIGHKLLLSAGDNKSRVLPIKNLSKTAFQIQFENPLSLEPDSIFSIISRTVKFASLPAHYTANVFDCSKNEIVYSFAMADIDSNSIVPCLGRTLPKDCYYININFSASAGTNKKYVVTGSLVLLMLLAWLAYFYYKRKKKVPISEGESTVPGKNEINIGKFIFYVDQRHLEIDGEKIELTDKETKLLHIFASAPNEIIDRQKLQKEVWENEGVIVTRSLDVFISKLRKKLEKDPNIKLVNIHNKGYKLELITT